MCTEGVEGWRFVGVVDCIVVGIVQSELVLGCQGCICQVTVSEAVLMYLYVYVSLDCSSLPAWVDELEGSRRVSCLLTSK